MNLRFYFLCCIFSTFASVAVYAQPVENDNTAQTFKIKMTFSDEYENLRSGEHTITKHLMRDEAGNIYAIKKTAFSAFKKRRMFIEKYSPNLKQVFDEELILKQPNGSILDFVSAFTFKGSAYVFGDDYDKKTKKIMLFASKIGDNGKPGKLIKLIEFASEKGNEHSELQLSKDSSKLLILSAMALDKEKREIPMLFSVFDANLELMWKGKMSYPLDRQSASSFSGTALALGNMSESDHYMRNPRSVLFSKFSVDNAGRVFALVVTPRDRDEKQKGDATNFYKLHIYENGAKETKKFTVDLNKKTIYDIKLLQTNDQNEVIGVGTYSENVKLNWFAENLGTNGTFYFKINTETGTITDKSITPFTPSLFEFMRIDSKDQAKGEGIQYVGLEDVWVTENNNVILFLEQQHLVIVRNYVGAGVGASSSGTTYIYHSDVMFNVKYDDKDKCTYQTLVPKALDVNGSEFGLYHLLLPRGETHALLFNDHRKNSEKVLKTYRDLSSVTPGGRNTYARMVSIDETGKRTNSTLFTKKDESFILNPSVRLKYAPGVIITAVNKVSSLDFLGGGTFESKQFKLLKVEY